MHTRKLNFCIALISLLSILIFLYYCHSFSYQDVKLDQQANEVFLFSSEASIAEIRTNGSSALWGVRRRVKGDFELFEIDPNLLKINYQEPTFTAMSAIVGRDGLFLLTPGKVQLRDFQTREVLATTSVDPAYGELVNHVGQPALYDKKGRFERLVFDHQRLLIGHAQSFQEAVLYEDASGRSVLWSSKKSQIIVNADATAKVIDVPPSCIVLTAMLLGEELHLLIKDSSIGRSRLVKVSTDSASMAEEHSLPFQVDRAIVIDRPKHAMMVMTREIDGISLRVLEKTEQGFSVSPKFPCPYGDPEIAVDKSSGLICVYDKFELLTGSGTYGSWHDSFFSLFQGLNGNSSLKELSLTTWDGLEFRNLTIPISRDSKSIKTACLLRERSKIVILWNGGRVQIVSIIAFER